MSTSDNQPRPIDFSTLKFSAPVEDSEELEENDYEEEYPFMKISIRPTLHPTTDCNGVRNILLL